MGSPVDQPWDVSGRIEAIRRLAPSEPALRFQGRWSSWGDLDRWSNRLEAQLREFVGRPGPVGVVLRNRAGIAAAIAALTSLREDVVSLNPAKPVEQLEADLLRRRPRALVASREDWEREGLRERSVAFGALTVAADDDSPVVLDEAAGVAGGGSATHRTGAPGIEVLTSGTTGAPKHVRLDYDAVSLAIANGERHHDPTGYLDLKLRRGLVIVALPLYHVAGLNALLGAFAAGRRVALFDRFDPMEWAVTVRNEQVVAAGLVPTAMRMVLDAEIPPEWLVSLKAVRAGSAPLDLETQIEFENRYDVVVSRAYGATEFSGGVAGMTYQDRRRFGDEKRGSVGRPHPGVRVRIVDVDTGQDVAEGVTGILHVAGEQIDVNDPDRWVDTNDLAHIDADGFLWIDGRRDDVIIRGGFKVNPREVEEALARHPDVGAVAVIGMPDARLGSVPVAALTAAAGRELPSEESLRTWLRGELEPYKIPTRIVAVEALPQTETMKTQREALRTLVATELGAP
jgi:long-chain acyl-CoA synthetase